MLAAAAVCLGLAAMLVSGKLVEIAERQPLGESRDQWLGLASGLDRAANYLSLNRPYDLILDARGAGSAAGRQVESIDAVAAAVGIDADLRVVGGADGTGAEGAGGAGAVPGSDDRAARWTRPSIRRRSRPPEEHLSPRIRAIRQRRMRLSSARSPAVPIPRPAARCLVIPTPSTANLAIPIPRMARGPAVSTPRPARGPAVPRPAARAGRGPATPAALSTAPAKARPGRNPSGGAVVGPGSARRRPRGRARPGAAAGSGGHPGGAAADLCGRGQSGHLPGPVAGHRPGPEPVRRDQWRPHLTSLARPDYFNWPAEVVAVAEADDPELIVFFWGPTTGRTCGPGRAPA